MVLGAGAASAAIVTAPISSKRGPSPFFDEWLNEEPIHRQQFERTLLAQLTLEWEGVARIARDMVSKRARSLVWV